MGAGITNFPSIQHRVFTLCCRLRTQLELSTSSTAAAQSQVRRCVDKECDDFLPWLEKKAGMQVTSMLSIGKSAYGRSLYACKYIKAGDCILKIPHCAQLASDKLLPQINTLLGDEVSDIAKVATVILYEKKLGQKSQWVPYISHLPQPMEMHSTIFWDDLELEMIRPSVLYQETIMQRKQIEKDFLAIKLASYNFRIFQDVTLQEFKHAYALVTSRAWQSSRGVSMIPFADFLNHDGTSESIVLSDEVKQLWEVIADRDYAPGDQVLIKYGKYSNATLALDFGFTLLNNTYDQVDIKLNISDDDHLYEMKLELLSRYCMPKLRDVNAFGSSRNAFTIKEVKSSVGKGRGIPQSVRAFARILCSESSEELTYLMMEAAENDGRLARRPLKNKSRENEAHQFLLSKVTESIEQYGEHIQLLRAACSHYSSTGHGLRRQMAQDVLTGELRVLKSASAWLKNYCATLSKGY